MQKFYATNWKQQHAGTAELMSALAYALHVATPGVMPGAGLALSKNSGQTTAAATNQPPTTIAEGNCTKQPTVSTTKRQRHTGTQGLHQTDSSRHCRHHRMRCGLTK